MKKAGNTITKYHYVYRITNTKENKHYYGVRSSKVEPKLDLGIKYFSSSTNKEFIQEQREKKGIFKYKIIKHFDSREKAIQLEIKLHNKFNVGVNESFYNKCKQTSIGFDTSDKKRTDASKEKQSNSTRGKKKSESWKNNISRALIGIDRGKGFKQKCRENNLGKNNPNFGKPLNKEHRDKISSKLINNIKVKCPHCDKVGSKSPMIRWHFDNCKNKGV